MSFSVHCLPAVLLIILSLPLSLSAQATPKQTVKTPGGSISGRVTIKEKGAAGVVVLLRKSDLMTQFEQLPRGTTDHDGYYRIANVPPGSYNVTPAAPAFVPADAKEPRPAKTVLVGEDENIEGINFALVRGGVITGRVTDADGRPVIQQRVFIYKSDAFQQQPQGQQQRPAFAMSGAQTDDRGIYRVFGLLPGSYKVAAGRSEEAFTPSSGPARSTYKQVFHPDVSDHTKAPVINVDEGTEATDVDIALGRALQTFAIAGRVVDGERGLPVPGIRLGVQRTVGQRPELVSTFANSNAQGDFIMEGLIPGKYGFYLSDQNAGMRIERITFDIVDHDLTGVTLKLLKGSSLSGIVALDTENKAARAMFSELQVRTSVSNPGMGASGGMSTSASSPIGADGSFHLAGLPGGTAYIMLGSMTRPLPPKGFSLVRLERDGVVVPRAIELKEGEQLTGFRVVLAYGTAIVQGVVTLENGTLPDGGRFDVRLIKPGEPPIMMTPVPTVDARGHFRIEGVAPGTYEVHASVSGLGPPFHHRVRKREITVADATTTDVTISIDMSGPLLRP